MIGMTAMDVYGLIVACMAISVFLVIVLVAIAFSSEHPPARHSLRGTSRISPKRTEGQLSQKRVPGGV